MSSKNTSGTDSCAPANGVVAHGDIQCNGRVIIYIIKADQTSYINYIKVLMLAEELQFPYLVSCIDTTQDWFYKVHPERYVPALKDTDPDTGEEFYVFEGTACLQHLASRFDVTGAWTGRTAFERAQVFTWAAYQTAGLGPSAKFWLYFSKGYPNRQSPEPLPKTIAKLHELCLKQWDILNQQLEKPEQEYIALRDRPTIADLAYLPFATPWMFNFFGVDIEDWPAVQAWSRRMLERPAIKLVLERAPMYGH